MAKMIKCPTCGTQIEIQQAGGQIIKCPGCGKGLKLVSKRPPGGQPPRDPSAASQGSLAGGSIAGGSIAAMTFHGDPPPLDDPPSLDSLCAVCGRPTDPDQLVEDNGNLICPDCVKGARSRIDRPAGGADLLEFKPPVPAPMKRGRVINFTPLFFAACLGGLVWGASEIYLNLVERPRGSKVAQANLPNPPGPGPDAPATQSTTPETSATQQSPTSDPPVAPVPPVAGDPATTPPAPPPPDPASTQPELVARGPTSTPPPAIDPTTRSIFGGDDIAPGPGVTNPADPPAPPPTPEIVAPAIDPGPVASDPLERGIELLASKDYAAAVTALDQARRTYVVGKLDPLTLTPQQAMVFEGLAAAYIGQGRADVAKAQLDAAYARGHRSRSLVLNRAIALLANRTASLTDLGVSLQDMQTYLQGNRNDEFASNIFGTLINRAAAMPKAPKEKIDSLWQSLDVYTDALAKDHVGQLKWGTEWLAAEDVLGYREVRKTGARISVTEAAKELEAARARVQKAEASLAKATDVVGAQKVLDDANRSLKLAQDRVAAAAATYKPPKWVEKLEPALPSSSPLMPLLP